jgi:hypothetical protein
MCWWLGGTRHETGSTMVFYTPESMKSHAEYINKILARHCESLVQELVHEVDQDKNVEQNRSDANRRVPTS